MKYNKVDIQADRAAGMTVKELSSKYGIPTRTIDRIISKSSIKDTEVDIFIPSKGVVDVIYTLAKRGNGITYKEEWDMLSTLIGIVTEDVRKSVRRSVRAKADKEGVVVTFVPNWLDCKNHTTPRDSVKLMCELAHNLQCHITESIDYYMQETGNTNTYDIKQSLLTYGVQGWSNIPLNSYCDIIDEVVCNLESFNNEKEN